ncbi:S1/P1 nuclease [Dyella koreensis]|uniref:S1/P1 nuclease n=1 Tax=Dyella koreensis TaxID=311235 RepID=A0ABW8KAJ5_9GAMM
MFPTRRVLASLLATLVLAPSAHAWGRQGHAIIAELAQRHLSPSAEAEIERLLAPDHTKSLADIASWADELRNDPAQQALWDKTRGLHYINFRSETCDYTPPRDCPDGLCIVGGLDHYVQVLEDRSQPDEARLQALKFVVHFVGDVHQPLHAGYRDDKGGNAYQVQFNGKGTNLHSVWDSGLLGTKGLDWQPYAKELDARGPVSLPPPIAPLDNNYAQWAEDSCAATRDIYPDGHKIEQAYVDKALPVAELRLREAGRRLAEVLNLALTGN